MRQDAVQSVLKRALDGHHLSQPESYGLFSALVRGELDAIEIAALLAALKVMGEQPPEIAGAAQALRDSALPFPRPDFEYADTCGTGGDGANTVNVSTAAAIVAAEAGVPVAKHGNRSVSSRCGSADVLEAVGVRLDASPEVSRRCLEEVGLCFFFAPQYHPGMRHAMPVRRKLATRTIFNIIGPLANPSQPAWQVVGVYEPRLCRPLAETLSLLGCSAALVVHGSGLDEVALHGPTCAALLRDGEVTELELTPAQAGVGEHPISALAGGEPQENAAWLRELLAGRGSEAHASAVAINAGALLWISGKAPDLRAGTSSARQALASGGAAERLEKWAELSRGA